MTLMSYQSQTLMMSPEGFTGNVLAKPTQADAECGLVSKETHNSQSITDYLPKEKSKTALQR
jgi:hypothetical protein